MAMQPVSTDRVFPAPQVSPTDYKAGNPLLKLMSLAATIELAAERDAYFVDQLQYLIPFDFLELYGPPNPDAANLDFRTQDAKTTFQKQNIRSYRTTDTFIVRGLATAGAWTGPFLHLAYRGGPDSKLSAAANHQLGDSIRLYLKIGSVDTPIPLTVPYNVRTDRYEIEIWAYPGTDLAAQLDGRGAEALASGAIIVSPPGLVQGGVDAFNREGLDDKSMADVSPNHTLHPILPLKLEVAWADRSLAHWDSNGGGNYRYEFNMFLRGWKNFLKVGISQAPHGGVGFLHYRNLFSNYGSFDGSGELGRTVEPYMFDAKGVKPAGPEYERSFSVDYMDIHILRPNCSIGIHRHRDNQEIFYLLEGDGYMVTGDWLQHPERARCFEIRKMTAGSLSLVKPGGLHALYNPTDANLSLLMFGGYD